MRNNIDGKELDQIISQLHQLDSDRAYQDPEALAKYAALAPQVITSNGAKTTRQVTIKT